MKNKKAIKHNPFGLCVAAFLLLITPQTAVAQEEDFGKQQIVLADADPLVSDADSLFMTDSLGPERHETIEQRLAKLVELPMFSTSQVGIMVYDLNADSALFCHNERQLMRPASTMKLVTAITALDLLGGSYQLKTQLKYKGTIKETDPRLFETSDSVETKTKDRRIRKTLEGKIYCIGGLDPRFNNDDMRAFVESIKKMGIDTIRATIVADNSMKDKDKFGEGWCWDDKNPSLVPLLVNGKDHFIESFIEKLRNAGITLDIRTEEGIAPHDAYELCTRTHTIDQILNRMMKKSDNLYAESLFYQIAHSQGGRNASAKSAATVIKRLIGKTGLHENNYRIADGSGLSLYNYLTAELEVMLLRYAWQNENIYYHLFASLPIAGEDGTLQSRMKSTYAAGNVRAKTGTVAAVSSLAGYCTSAEGHELCFSIINNGLLSTSKGRAFQDKVCQALCAP